jgi:hypothetical protein
MNVFKPVIDGLRYISEAVSRIFSPSDDHYPETGIQPFDGEPYSQWVSPTGETKKHK